MATNKCRECFHQITISEYNYSVEKFEVPLCLKCQQKLKDPLSNATPEAIGLYFALRKNGVSAELEKNDGYKHIDIAVTKARLNIEVDGVQHNTSLDQTISDLRRTYYSFKKGYFTLRIPNTLLHNEKTFLETVDLICEIAEISKDRFQALNANRSKEKPKSNNLLSGILSWFD